MGAIDMLASSRVRRFSPILNLYRYNPEHKQIIIIDSRKKELNTIKKNNGGWLRFGQTYIAPVWPKLQTKKNTQQNISQRLNTEMESSR